MRLHDFQRLSGVVVALCLLTHSAPLRAEVTLATSAGWVASTDGRINGFASYTRAEGVPLAPKDPSQPVNVAGTSLEDLTDKHNRIEAFRIRSGFVGSILGFKLEKTFSDALTLTGRFQLWTVNESSRQASERNLPDMREANLRAAGFWGGVLVGRSVGLFSRGAIEINFLYGHDFGLGHPCDTNSRCRAGTGRRLAPRRVQHRGSVLGRRQRHAVEPSRRDGGDPDGRGPRRGLSTARADPRRDGAEELLGVPGPIQPRANAAGRDATDLRGQIRNCSLVVPGIAPAPAHFDGNFVQLDVVSWAVAP